MQDSDNFRLNEAAPFVEEENLEEVGEEADELENYNFAWFACHGFACLV